MKDLVLWSLFFVILSNTYSQNRVVNPLEKGIVRNFDEELHFALDAFLDLPFTGGNALTLYSSFFRFNYGPNYHLYGGTANVYGSGPVAGTGLSEPGFGTGGALAIQAAWLLAKTIGKSGRIQLYYEGDYRFYDVFDDAALHHNSGVNYFILGHNLKLTLQEELRPYMEDMKFKTY